MQKLTTPSEAAEEICTLRTLETLAAGLARLQLPSLPVYLS